jgi:Domain of unknown function (DUF4279)
VPTTSEYIGNVRLIITGTSLDPAHVTRLLRMKPFTSWRPGDRVTKSSLHREGGWIAKLSASAHSRPIESQLKAWLRKLTSAAAPIRRLQAEGYYCRLRWFVATESTVSIVLPNELQRALARLNLHWEISMFAHKGSDERAS